MNFDKIYCYVNKHLSLFYAIFSFSEIAGMALCLTFSNYVLFLILLAVFFADTITYCVVSWRREKAFLAQKDRNMLNIIRKTLGDNKI